MIIISLPASGLEPTISIENMSEVVVSSGVMTELGSSIEAGLFNYGYEYTGTAGEQYKISIDAGEIITDPLVRYNEIYISEDSEQGATLLQIESSTIIAKELTLSGKASQDSVDSIPTNPLLSNDIRLDNLDVPISSVSGGGSGGATLAEIEGSLILAKELTVQSRASQLSVNSIPTTPLLSNDVRLDNLDAKISTRATPNDVSVTVEASAKITNIESKVIILERMERATVRISGTQLIMEDLVGEIQRWNLKDSNGNPTSSIPYKKEKV